MKSKKSARLGFAAAVWLVLSVAVFGTLIGIAWMSMNVTSDLSTDAIVVDAVEEASNARDPIFHGIPGVYYHTPSSAEEGSTTLIPIVFGKPGVCYYTPD